MNDYDLFDAFGDIDDELLKQSEHKPARRVPFRKALIAAAAVMLLAVTAMASPAIREWFYNATLTKTAEAQLTYTDGQEDHHWAVGRVDLTLPEDVELPVSIEVLRIPTYFDNTPVEWVYTPAIAMPGEPLYFYEGIWRSHDGEVEQSINFHQSVVEPDGKNQFSISLGNDSTVAESTMLIDDKEYKVYTVGPSSFGDFAFFHESTHVIWFDGEYAFQIIAYGIDHDVLEEIIRSIEPADNLHRYIRDAIYDPVDTYYTLTELPEDLHLTGTEDNGYYTWQSWGSLSRGVDLWQQRIQLDGNDIDNRDLAFTLSDLHNTYPDSQIDTFEVNEMTVSVIWYEENAHAYWTQDGCDFILCFYGYPNLTIDQINASITGLVPVEDFDGLMTE